MPASAAAAPQPLRETRPLVAPPDAPPRHLRALPAHTIAVRRTAPQPPHTTQEFGGEEPPPPDPRFIQRIAVSAYEIIDGTRAVAQLGAWISADVADALGERRRARVERNSLYRDRRRVVPIPGRVHLDQPRPRVYESTVVLRTPARAVAVALRLEVVRARWRVTHLTVL